MTVARAVTCRPLKPGVILAGGLAAACLLWVVFGWRILRLLTGIYLSNGNYSHGFLVPFLAGAMVWQRREALPRAPETARWPGLLLTAAGVLLTVLGVWYDAALQPGYLGYVFLLGLGLLICLIGLCWALLGTARLRVIALPLCFLVFALPLPESFVTRLTLPLQSLAAALSAGLLRVLGVAVLREGNVLRLAAGVMGVDEACSGLRSTWVLLAAAVAVALLWRLRGTRVLVLLAAVPGLAIVANVIRIVVTALLLAHGAPGLAQGAAHEALGLAAVALSAAGLFALAGGRRPLRRPPAPPAADGTCPPRPWRMAFSAACASALLATGAVSNRAIGEHYRHQTAAVDSAMPARRSLTEFPAEVGVFTRLTAREMRPEESVALQPSDSLLTLYRGPSGQRLYFTVFYWNPRRTRVTGSGFKFPHHVDDCYIYGGWSRRRLEPAETALACLPGETLSQRLFVKGDHEQVVVYWRSMDRRPLISDFFGRGIRQRLAAMLRSWNEPVTEVIDAQYSVTLAMEANPTPDEARKTVIEFAEAAAPLLPDYGVSREAIPPR